VGRREEGEDRVRKGKRVGRVKKVERGKGRCSVAESREAGKVKMDRIAVIKS